MTEAYTLAAGDDQGGNPVIRDEGLACRFCCGVTVHIFGHPGYGDNQWWFYLGRQGGNTTGLSTIFVKLKDQVKIKSGYVVIEFFLSIDG
ncbi:MAG: hypothetical protein A4E62_01492 [Syntrophorhabdus sp. PtaU1.Bin002]|nr:MAG: hypothetical protein A4E62_01492 [Syntrophorhabdus sp. PtaU1.Bin002]